MAKVIDEKSHHERLQRLVGEALNARDSISTLLAGLKALNQQCVDTCIEINSPLAIKGKLVTELGYNPWEFSAELS